MWLYGNAAIPLHFDDAFKTTSRHRVACEAPSWVEPHLMRRVLFAKQAHAAR